MPRPGYYGVVSDDFVIVDPEGCGPAGISHAVVFGTVTTLCGLALEPFYSFYEHAFTEDGLNRCDVCACGRVSSGSARLAGARQH